MAGQASKALASSTIEIDAEALRTSQTVSFTETIAQVTLRVPERGPDSPPRISISRSPTSRFPSTGSPPNRSLAASTATPRLTIDLDQPSDDFTISYVASGAIVHTEPSSAPAPRHW